MANGLQPGFRFAVRFDDDSRGIRGMCLTEHFFFVHGVKFPILLVFVIDRANFPVLRDNCPDI